MAKEREVALAGTEGAPIPRPDIPRGVRRKEGASLGVPRLKLSISERTIRYFESRRERPRWINDDPGRLEFAEEAGYRFVTKGEILDPIGEGADIAAVEGQDSRVSRVVGTRESLAPTVAYLMAIPEELYQEDQEKQLALIKQREAAMSQGVDEQGAPGKDGRYIPKQGISIKRA